MRALDPAQAIRMTVRHCVCTLKGKAHPRGSDRIEDVVKGVAQRLEGQDHALGLLLPLALGAPHRAGAGAPGGAAPRRLCGRALVVSTE